MRNESGWNIGARTIACAAMVMSVFSFGTIPKAAAQGGPTLSAFGIATLDGVQAPGEWDNAAKLDFAVDKLPSEGGGTTPARLFGMNDATNLCPAVKVARSSLDNLIFSLTKNRSVGFDFYSNPNGVLPNGDDALVLNAQLGRLFDDFRSSQPPSPSGSPLLRPCGYPSQVYRSYFHIPMP
jgi:hypothetical protein